MKHHLNFATEIQFTIRLDDPGSPDIRAFLEAHLNDMRAVSPPESKHALDVEGLRKPEISFWTVRDGVQLIACGALKAIDETHGEIKSMRVVESHRGRGVASLLLRHLVAVARQRNYSRLSLETGSMDFFRPARALYDRHGFEPCPPFADYKPDQNSVFMTLRLERET